MAPKTAKAKQALKNKLFDILNKPAPVKKFPYRDAESRYVAPELQFKPITAVRVRKQVAFEPEPEPEDVFPTLKPDAESDSETPSVPAAKKSKKRARDEDHDLGESVPKKKSNIAAVKDSPASTGRGIKREQYDDAADEDEGSEPQKKIKPEPELEIMMKPVAEPEPPFSLTAITSSKRAGTLENGKSFLSMKKGVKREPEDSEIITASSS